MSKQSNHHELNQVDNPEYFNPDGTLKSTAQRKRDESAPRQTKVQSTGTDHEGWELRGMSHDERTAYYRSLDSAKRRAQQKINPQRPETPYREWIETLERQLKAAVNEGHRREIEKRLEIHLTSEQNWLAEQKQKQQRERYWADPQVINAMEHAEAFARTPPHASERLAAVEALAILRGSQDGDAAQATARYWDLVRAIEDRSYAKLDAELQTKIEAAAPVQAEINQLQARRDQIGKTRDTRDTGDTQ